MKTLQQSVVQFARNACALTHPRFEGHIELVGELTACIVKRLCQDRQLVTSDNLRSVLKITTSQGFGACGKFGERNCNRPSNVPTQGSGRERRQHGSYWSKYKKTSPRLPSVFDRLSPLQARLLVYSFHQRCAQADQVLHLLSEAESNSSPITGIRKLDRSVKLRWKRYLQSLQRTGDRSVLFTCAKHLLGLSNVLQKSLLERGNFTGKLLSVMAVRQGSHLVPEGIDIEVDSYNSKRRLVRVTQAFDRSRHSSELPDG